MGWIPASLIEDMTPMVSIAGRNEREQDRYVGWYPDKMMLVAVSNKYRAAAYLSVNERAAELFPEKSCRIWVPKGRKSISKPVRVAAEDEAPDAISEFKKLFASIGEKVREYVPNLPYMKLKDYSEVIREMTDRQVKASRMQPFRDWHFNKIIIHEDGVRFVESGRRQLIIGYKPFIKKREFEKTKIISDFLKEI